MAQKTAPRKRTAGSAPGGRQSFHISKDHEAEVDDKNVNQLRRYNTEKGKMRSRRNSGAWSGRRS